MVYVCVHKWVTGCGWECGWKDDIMSDWVVGGGHEQILITSGVTRTPTVSVSASESSVNVSASYM